MTRDQSTREFCAICGRPRASDELFSWRGRCGECADSRLRAQQNNPMDADPEWWAKWRRGMAESIGLTLPDDPMPQNVRD